MKQTIELNNFKCPSWNTMYAGIHWSKRKKLADVIHEQVYYAVKQQCRNIKFYKLVKITFHIYIKGTRKRDVDNFAVKFIIDGLVKSGIIEADDLYKVYAIEIYGYYSKEDKVLIVIDDNKGKI